MKRLLGVSFALASVGLLCGAGTYLPGIPRFETPLGNRLSLLSLVPFAGLLTAIAILPLAARRWWKHNANKALVAACFAVPTIMMLWLHFGRHGLEAVGERAKDYVSFLALLGSLYVIAGGLYVQGSTVATPRLNTGVLALGAVLANVIGTTGASMVLVRPLIRANARRRRVAHVLIFFVFIVSNCGGLLTPLGDPPLFLGYLAGVPFEWTLRLFPHWALVNGTLLVIFNVWDRATLAGDSRDPSPQRSDVSPKLLERESLRLHGTFNLLFLVAIMATVAAAGRGLGNGGHRWPFGIQEGVMVTLAVGSYLVTAREIHAKNSFSFGPISEVAVLFAGVFVTMTPALLLLNARSEVIGLHTPRQYFWTSGLLSGVLDNAPTYLTFVSIACGSVGISIEGPYLEHFLAMREPASAEAILAAISCGCVFMGALTYIGNGPNLMVKAIGEEMNVRMPGFFGYLAYSIPVLFSTFGLATLVFFRN